MRPFSLGVFLWGKRTAQLCYESVNIAPDGQRRMLVAELSPRSNGIKMRLFHVFSIGPNNKFDETGRVHIAPTTKARLPRGDCPAPVHPPTPGGRGQAGRRCCTLEAPGQLSVRSG